MKIRIIIPLMHLSNVGGIKHTLSTCITYKYMQDRLLHNMYRTRFNAAARSVTIMVIITVGERERREVDKTGRWQQ